MEWLEWVGVSPEAGLWGLLIGSFLSATVLPGGSEVMLFAFLSKHPDALYPALAVCTVGNTAGGMTSWWAGLALPATHYQSRIPYLDSVKRWGSSSLLLSWAPFFGDALCLAAGWLRLHWLPCLVFMSVGKLARYWLVALSS